MQSYNNNKSAIDGIAGFLSKNLITLLVVIFVFPIALKYLKKMNWSLEKQQREHEKDVSFRETRNIDVRTQRYNEVLQRGNIGIGSQYADLLIKTAEKLAHDLGTIYSDTDSFWSWLNPRGWTENDKEVANTVINLNNAVGDKMLRDWQTVVGLYYIYTRSRDLDVDIRQYLDDAQIKQINEACNGNFGFI